MSCACRREATEALSVALMFQVVQDSLLDLVKSGKVVNESRKENFEEVITHLRACNSTSRDKFKSLMMCPRMTHRQFMLITKTPRPERIQLVRNLRAARDGNVKAARTAITTVHSIIGSALCAYRHAST